MNTTDTTPILLTLSTKLDALLNEVAALKRTSCEGYIAGDKSAMALLQIASAETFKNLMRDQGIKPVRTARAKLWRRADLANLRGDDTPFAQNNPRPFAGRRPAASAKPAAGATPAKTTGQPTASTTPAAKPRHQHHA
jgi:hypothetical protein